MPKYKFREPGGFVFAGKNYPEHSTHDLEADGWGAIDIENALRSGLIVLVEEPSKPTKKEVETKEEQDG